MFIDFRGGGREEREKETEREKHQYVKRNINSFPPIHTLTRDWTYGYMPWPVIESATFW